mgnify:FL=1|jgi:hypothetical protein
MSEGTLIEEVDKQKQERNLQLQKDMASHFMEEIQHRVLIADKAHELGKKVIIVDIDGTICRQVGNPGESVDANEFTNAEPFPKRIEYLNSLHDEGHYIHYWTARGCWHGNDTLKETREQLDSWGVKYNDLAVFKPFYDIWIDDKGVGVRRDTEGSITEFKANISQAIEML